MPQPEATRQLYLTLQRLHLVLLAATRRAWSGMREDDFDRSWAQLAPALLAVVTAGQLAAARSGSEYVPAVLAETGQPDRPDAVVVPSAFAGVAADGRSLAGLLSGAVVMAKRVTRGRVVEDDDGLLRYIPGLPADQALAAGGRWLEALVQSATSDAARLATSAEIATREGMGWTRVVHPPCCGRCALLAGRWYRYDAGFRRHPRCDCGQIPTVERGWRQLGVDPDDLFTRGRVQGLTQLERQRLAAGEDRTKVINASRDMWRATLAEQRRADADAAAGAPAAPTARDQQARQGLEDLFAATRSRVEALTAMKAVGFIQ